jgi:hypothetical protein
MPIPIDRIRCKSGSTCLSSDIRFSSIWQLFLSILSDRLREFRRANSATIFLGSYRQMLHVIKYCHKPLRLFEREIMLA